MSIHLTSSQLTETPEHIRQRAKRLVEETMKTEGLKIDNKSIKWAIEATAKNLEASDSVGPEDLTIYMNDLEGNLPKQIDNINQINWSHGYEKTVKTFPSIEEFKPIADWLVRLASKYNLFSRKIGESFETEFHNKMSEFINHLTNKIQEDAISSRKASLAQLKEKLPATSSLETEESYHPSDEEVEIAIATGSIDNLEKNKTPAALLELRDLLNLSRTPFSTREPNMDEQRAFRFLWKIFQQPTQKETNNSGPSSLLAKPKIQSIL